MTVPNPTDEGRARVEHAEQLVAGMGIVARRLGLRGAVVAMRGAVRTREMVEDLVAEARAVARDGRPSRGP